MKVLNKRTDQIPVEAVYVGRPSKWGNPMTVKELQRLFPNDTLTELNRKAVRWYERYLAENAKLMDDIEELTGKDLVCWCAPLPCHADVLLKLANEEDE